MLLRHGLFLKSERNNVYSPPFLRMGIMDIFDLMKSAGLLKSTDLLTRAANVDHHFGAALNRFVFSLFELNGLMHSFVNDPLDKAECIVNSSRIQLKAGCIADQIFTYLNSLVDDVAVLIALATEYAASSSSQMIDSMGKLRSTNVLSDTKLALVKPLLLETHESNSWWHYGFGKGQGIRQLVVHNQHLVMFQKSGPRGGPLEAQAFVCAPFEKQSIPFFDFFSVIGTTLLGLFDWLERLEKILASYLQPKCSNWQPLSRETGLQLPMAYPNEVVHYDSKYFPIPCCHGSAELPWIIETMYEFKNDDKANDMV